MKEKPAVADKYRYLNPEVLYSRAAITTADRADIESFKLTAGKNERKRIRLCTHSDAKDPLHEMLIVHEREAYVRPHRHPGKTESMHVIDGLVDVIVFDEAGQVQRIISMGGFSSGRTFYYRMAAPVFHTLMIRSDVLVFHETTNGPFDRKDTVFAPWSPEDGDPQGIDAFMTALEEKIRVIKHDSQEKN